MPTNTQSAKQQILEKYSNMAGQPFMYAQDFESESCFIAQHTTYWYTGFIETDNGIYHIFCREPLTPHEAMMRSQVMHYAPPFAQYFDYDERITKSIIPAPRQQTNPYVYMIHPYVDEVNIFEGLIQIEVE